MKLPIRWSSANAEEVCERISVGIVIEPSKYYTPDPQGVRAFRSANVRAGKINNSNWVRLSAEGHAANTKSHLQAGDVVIVRTGAPGTACVVTNEFAGSNCIDLIFARPRADLIDSDYLCLYINSEHGKRQALSMQGGLAQQHLNVGAFQQIRLPIPPLPEQRKIAEILTTWDNGLDKLDALIEAQERRKKALMQQLLTGRRRLKGFDQSKGKTESDRFGAYPADWQRVLLGDVTREVTNRNAKGTNMPVLSCTKHRGLVLSEDYFGKRVHAEDTSAYRIVRRGEFAYATNHVEEGSIGYQNICEAGLVSPIYTVFKTTDVVDDSYFFRVLKSPLLVHLYQINTSASVDRRGSLRYEEFSRIHIWLPNKAEQTAIANVFETVDQELALLRAKRAVLDQQKRGLMQRLLTGGIRVVAN